MKIIFVTTKEERYEEFRMLVPWKTKMIIYIESYDHETGKVEIILPKNIAPYCTPDNVVLIDIFTYELCALNGLPGRNYQLLQEIGLENIQKIAKYRGSRMRQRTVFKIISGSEDFKCIKELKSSVNGSLMIEKKGSFKSFDEIFMLDYYDIAFCNIPFEERSIVGSIGQATKLFIDWVIKQKLMLEKKEAIDNAQNP